MSHTTETLHVRGVRRARLVDAVTHRLKGLRWTYVALAERKQVERTEPELRRLVLRRDGKWLTLADSAGFDRRTTRANPPDADIESWGEYLSHALDRSVLTVWTWDGEASVRATRWKRGKSCGVLSLLEEAYRGSDGLPYAPAKIFRPWLSPDQREAILGRGIKLVTPSGESTGDAELDALLAGFDESERAESEFDEEDPDHVFVDESISVAALCAAVGMKDPFLNPWMPRDEDEELVFRR
jgi:hypothetical protein